MSKEFLLFGTGPVLIFDGFVPLMGDVVALTDTCRVLTSSGGLLDDELEDHLNHDRRGRLLS